MAKKSKIVREIHLKKMVDKYSAKRKELKSMEFPPAPAAKLIPEVEERSDGEKRSWVVWLENQEEMKGYVNQLMQQLGGQSDPEPDRRFHVSLANLTGKPGDSVR